MKKNVLLAIGEALIDFIPDKAGCDFSDVSAFLPCVGGAPANVCGAFSKLGGRAKMITQLGNDPFGHKITRELSGYGIDTSCISYTNQANTALAFVSLGTDGNRTFSFYRKPSADMLMTAEQIEKKWFDEAFVLHFCSVSLGNFPMRDAHKRAIEFAKASDTLISFDPNLRFPLWENKEELKEAVTHFLPQADIVKISDEELEFITGTNQIENAVLSLFDRGVRLVIYTCGKKGAYAFTRTESVFSKGFTVNAVDTTGAGDGFIGAFLWKLYKNQITVQNLDAVTKDVLQESLDFANRFCAISVQHQGAIVSYPDIEKMEN